MQIAIKTKYINEVAELSFKQYTDGSLAILLTALDGEPLAKATVCLAEYGYTPPKDSVAVKDYSENIGMMYALVEGGVIENPHDQVAGGMVMFPICKLTEAGMNAAISTGIPRDYFD